MTVVALALVHTTLAAGDRFELTFDAGPKLRPRSTRSGRILEDRGEFWKVRFDRTTESRVICKAFIQAERRR